MTDSPSFCTETVAYTIAMMVRDYLRHSKTYYGAIKSSKLRQIKPTFTPLRGLYADLDAAEFGAVAAKPFASR